MIWTIWFDMAKNGHGTAVVKIKIRAFSIESYFNTPLYSEWKSLVKKFYFFKANFMGPLKPIGSNT